jgi:peptide deformylase
MILDILPDNHPMLHKPAERFDFDNPPMDPEQLFQDLKETLIARRSVGLSAVQCGIPYQVFIVGDPFEPDSIFSVFNPKVVNQGNEITIMEEGCLTFPGLFIKIKRPSKVRARFSGHDGNIDTLTMDGYTARTFLHEYDHINGILFNERASKLQLDRAKKQKLKLDRIRKRNAQ